MTKFPKTKIIFITLLFFGLFGWAEGSRAAVSPCQLSTNPNSLTTTCDEVVPPNIARPAVGVDNTDAFGNTYRRITPTDGNETVATFPNYAKNPAWNSDGSKLLLGGAASGPTATNWYLLNGSNYAYIRNFTGVGIENYFWSRTDPNIFYYFPNYGGVNLRYYDISNSTDHIQHTFTAANFNVGSIDKVHNWTEGNTDDSSGRYWVLMGFLSGTRVGVAVYDKQTDTVLSGKNFSSNGMCGTEACGSRPDWVGMSHSGNHVIVQWGSTCAADDLSTRGCGTEVFDRNLVYQRKVTEASNHLDLAQMADGTDVLFGRRVMSSGTGGTYSSRTMRAISLDNGAILQSCVLPVENGWHLSGRTNVSNSKGWILMSIYDQNNPGYGSGILQNENIAINIDTCQVRRLGHHEGYGNTSVYRSTSFASPNWDFTKVVWQSNWRNSTDPSLVQTYVTDVDWGSESPPPTDTTPPAAPTGLVVQ